MSWFNLHIFFEMIIMSIFAVAGFMVMRDARKDNLPPLDPVVSVYQYFIVWLALLLSCLNNILLFMGVV